MSSLSRFDDLGRDERIISCTADLILKKFRKISIVRDLKNTTNKSSHERNRGSLLNCLNQTSGSSEKITTKHLLTVYHYLLGMILPWVYRSTS